MINHKLAAYFVDEDLLRSLIESHDSVDQIWEAATTAIVGGITLVREPDESAEFFRARVEAFIERMDGGLH